ncbi:hypothetical protein BJX65DRAFT_262886 [Aspergillus insuetus]
MKPGMDGKLTASAGSVVLVAPGDPTEFKRKQHAQAQKNQRDRMKAALDRIAQIMEGGGVNAGTSTTTTGVTKVSSSRDQSRPDGANPGRAWCHEPVLIRRIVI